MIGAAVGLTCAILAGGLGTRLSSVLRRTPKVMAKIQGRPFLELLVAQAREAGCGEVVLLVGHRAEFIERHFGDGAAFGIPVHYSREQDLRGTGGALALAARSIRSDPFFLLNGDSYCSVDLSALAARHRAAQAWITIVTCRVGERGRFGSLEVDNADRVVAFLEKNSSTGAGLVNAGVYCMRREVLDHIPPGKIVSLERDILPSGLAGGLHAYRQEGEFLDIGTPASLRRARRVLAGILERRRHLGCP